MSTTNFQALMLAQDGARRVAAMRTLSVDDLPEGDVLVEVHYSSVNFKDALALADKGIIRQVPAIPGIDLAGVVAESASANHRVGDPVVLTGWGVGEHHWGGYSGYARVKSEWLLPLPAGLTLKQSMQVGTAGLAAMLAVLALEQHGVPPAAGPVMVSGASGGVGSVALAILAGLGYEPWAMTGRTQQHAYLKALGATQIVARDAYTRDAGAARPAMASALFGAAIDTVGGDTLAALIARVGYGGAVAACGLVGGTDLNTTVFPFILRGVSLLGIDTVRCPAAKRAGAWARIAAVLPRDKLDAMSREVTLEQVPALAQQMLAGQGTGRTVVKVRA